MFTNLLKVALIAFIYGTILIFVGPLIDHAFTDLHKDEDNWEILFENFFIQLEVFLFHQIHIKFRIPTF